MSAMSRPPRSARAVDPERLPRRMRAAGVVAVTVALGTGELLAGLIRGAPSPLDALGQQVVGILPGSVVSFAIATFGTANRTVLVVSSVAVALLLGAAVGRGAIRSLIPAVVSFVAVSLLAIPASLAQPEARLGPVLGVLAVAALAGLGVLAALRNLASRAAAAANGDDAFRADGLQTARRSFLRVSVGTAALGALSGVIGRSVLGGGAGPLVDPVTFELPRPDRPLPEVTAGQDLATQVPGATSLFTPNDAFFRIDSAIAVPQVDPTTWSLHIRGLVERELTFDLDGLLARDLHEVDATISCVSNEVGGDLVGTARWLGVPLRELLDEAGIEDRAEQVVGRSVDGWTGGFPIEVALDGREALVAVGMNGEALPIQHGFPARLIIPGLYGYVSATKWLSEIELTTWDGFDGYWVPRGWSKLGPVKTQSRIDVPSNDASVAVGETVVAGVAWAGIRGLRAVEVRLDDATWTTTDLQEPLSDAAWVQWQVTLPLAAGDHTLAVRAVDGEGARQPEGPRPPPPDGAEGWHTIRVTAA